MKAASILLVDDEDNLRSMLEAALSHHGFIVESASNGRSAVEKAQAATPDLILLDVMMPDLDGFEVCRRLRADGTKSPILFLTAKDATEDKVRGLTLGGDDYLTKPFSLEELVARVNALLRRSGKDSSTAAVLRCADLQLDDDAHRVTRGGKEIAHESRSRHVEGPDPRSRMALRFRRRRRNRRDLRGLPASED
jgi:two-component system, OmpR family, response regulator